GNGAHLLWRRRSQFHVVLPRHRRDFRSGLQPRQPAQSAGAGDPDRYRAGRRCGHRRVQAGRAGQLSPGRSRAVARRARTRRRPSGRRTAERGDLRGQDRSRRRPLMAATQAKKANVAMNAVPRLRQDYAGPALLSYGFRPFFVLGALYAALAMLVWLPFFYGELTVATAFAPRDWHIHEMLFGYLAAIITGFLLTAVPNWTG